MVVLEDPSSVKVYTVNGAASGSSSSLPDWLTRKRVAKKGKRAIREHIEGTIDLVQEFEFPEASNRIKTTRDGHHAIATGVYKPQMRCYDLDQLTLKFERHSDAENIDFIILSDDWTKTLQLQADRSIELHTQGGLHYRTRIPRFGRAVDYHFPSCDAYVGASGPDVYRLNLDQGRFLNPLSLESDGEGPIAGVNAVNINPAHQLLALGIEGNGSVQFWDPRSRSRVGTLRIPSRLAASGSLVSALPGVDDAATSSGLSVTALASRTDGLSYAVGTSTGHTLLYDIRSPRPYATKDLGYGLPVKSVSWIEGGSKMAGDGMVLSADRKVIKIWDKNNPEGNFASVTPAYDINDVHHLPATGLLMIANEGIQMTSYYIPQLGPAPKWCSFLDNITEEMEDQTIRNVYEDYKFVERDELAKLGLEHLVGTPALKPYMHGYFLSLRLYDTARAIANPFAYEEHKARRLQEKVDKLTESRIRTRKNAPLPKVNKALAERIQVEEEKAAKAEQKKLERRKRKATAEEGVVNEEPEDADRDEDSKKARSKKATVLSDPRFSALFENPEFEVDEESREFKLLNPSTVAQREKQRTRAAVDEEDSFGSASPSQSDADSQKDEDEESGSEANSSDNSDAQSPSVSLRKEKEKLRSIQESSSRRTGKMPNMVPAAPRVESRDGVRHSITNDRTATFGQRRKGFPTRTSNLKASGDVNGDMEVSWIPSASKDHSDSLFDDDDRALRNKDVSKRKSETFGAGLERGGFADGEKTRDLSESERHGRTKRRNNVRSGSRNVLRDR